VMKDKEKTERPKCRCGLGEGQCPEKALADSMYCPYCEDHSYHYHCTKCGAAYIPSAESDRLCFQCRSNDHYDDEM